MKNLDQTLLEEAYNAVVTEGVLPSKAFRSKPLHQKKVIYRLFIKPEEKMRNKYFWGEKLSWAGEYESVEAALIHMKNLYVYSENMEYVIKEVIIEYSEKTVEQSGLRQMRDDLPELKGIF